MKTTTHVSQAEASAALDILGDFVPELSQDDEEAAFRASEIIRRYIAQGAPEGQAVAFPDEPLPVFSSGTWTYEETGETFDASVLDEQAHIEYSQLAHPIPRASAAGAPTNSADIGSKSVGVPAGYDRELIASMLDAYVAHAACDMDLIHLESSIAEQARLLREADNADARHVRTAMLATSPAPPDEGSTRYGWTQAPGWAMWAATDASGNSYWHAAKPTAFEASQEWCSSPKSALIAFGDYRKNWRETLEQRPTTTRSDGETCESAQPECGPVDSAKDGGA